MFFFLRNQENSNEVIFVRNIWPDQRLIFDLIDRFYVASLIFPEKSQNFPFKTLRKQKYFIYNSRKYTQITFSCLIRTRYSMKLMWDERAWRAILLWFQVQIPLYLCVWMCIIRVHSVHLYMVRENVLMKITYVKGENVENFLYMSEKNTGGCSLKWKCVLCKYYPCTCRCVSILSKQEMASFCLEKENSME